MLEELARSTLDEVAARAGWSDTRASFPVRDRPVVALGPLVLWADQATDISGSSTVRELARCELAAAAGLIDDLAESACWPTLRLAQRGWKRWWIGGLVAELERSGAREAFEAELLELARLAPAHPVRIPWFDDLAASLAAGARSGPILDVPSHVPDRAMVELDLARLARLLEWSSSVPRFHPYLSHDTTDPGQWDAFVRQHVSLLRSVAPNESLVAVI